MAAAAAEVVVADGNSSTVKTYSMAQEISFDDFLQKKQRLLKMDCPFRILQIKLFLMSL